MKVDATFEKAPLTLSSLYMSEGKAEKAIKVLVTTLCVQMHVEVSIIPPNRVYLFTGLDWTTGLTFDPKKWHKSVLNLALQLYCFEGLMAL